MFSLLLTHGSQRGFSFSRFWSAGHLAIAERPTAITWLNYGPNWIGTHRHTHYGSEMQTVDGSIEIGFGSPRTINHLAMTDDLILSASPIRPRSNFNEPQTRYKDAFTY
jgi:hypothetical protein